MKFSLSFLVALLSVAAGAMDCIDLSADRSGDVVIAAGTGDLYQGHPTTVRTADGRIIAVWCTPHGGYCGPAAESKDGGRSWTRIDERFPKGYRGHVNCPSIYRLIGPDGKARLWVWSAIASAADDPLTDFLKAWTDRARSMPSVVSEDEGLTWKEMPPLGPKFISVMTFSSIVRLKDGSYLGLFHNGPDGSDLPPLRVMQSVTKDGGFTWSDPVEVCAVEGKCPCEPYVFRAPKGDELCCLMRENARTGRSLMMFSRDEGRTWTAAVDAPWALTGDRHQGVQLPDGRLCIVFRDKAPGSTADDHFVAWVGTYDELKSGREGNSFRIKLLHSYAGPDCGYPGIHLLEDGTLLATTYIKYWNDARRQSVIAKRFRIPTRPFARSVAKENILRAKVDKIWPPPHGHVGSYPVTNAIRRQTVHLPDSGKGAPTFAFGKDGTFTVMQVTDPHWMALTVPEREKRFYAAVAKRFKPDLAVLTGDLVNLRWKGDTGFDAAAKAFISLLTENGIPFALTLGNHDSEFVGKDYYTGPELWEAYRKLGGPLFVDYAVSQLGGVASGVIHLQQDGRTKFDLYILDSGDYAPYGGNDEWGEYDGYDGVRGEQIEWVREQLKGGVPALFFQHIPVPEIEDSTDGGKTQGRGLFMRVDGKPPKGASAKIRDAFYAVNPARAKGVLAEPPCPLGSQSQSLPRYHTADGLTLYDVWKASGCVRGAYFGHDHSNTYDGVTTDGVRLGSAPGSSSVSREDFGVRIFTIRADGTFETQVVTESSGPTHLDF